MPVRCSARAAKLPLVVLLDLAPAGAKLGILGERLEPPQLRQILDPAVADVLVK